MHPTVCMPATHVMDQISSIWRNRVMKHPGGTRNLWRTDKELISMILGGIK